MDSNFRVTLFDGKKSERLRLIRRIVIGMMVFGLIFVGVTALFFPEVITDEVPLWGKFAMMFYLLR